MTYSTEPTLHPGSRLPDPMEEPRFYDGVLLKRAFAWIVDILLISVMTFAASLVTLGAGFFLWPVFFLAIGALYRVVTISNGSATWGMRLMGTELRGHDGERFDPFHAVLHVTGYYGSMIFVLPMLVSIAAMAMTSRRQGLTDLVLGSALVNKPG